MKYSLLVSFCLFLSIQNIWAQVGGGRASNRELRTLHYNSLIVSDASRKLDSLFAMSHNVDTFHVDSMSNPYYASLMGSPALYPTMLHRLFGIGGEKKTQETTYFTSDIATLLHHTDEYVVNACILYPKIVLPCEKSQMTLLDKTVLAEEHPNIGLSQRYTLSEVKTEGEDGVLSPIEGNDYGIIVRRPNFWTFKTNFSLQFTQNYVSDNWYKGGESHNALLASTVIEANYNNQQKFTFDNKLEMKLGFQTSHNDEEHKYKTNSDLLRLTNKMGLRAVKHWYYTLMLQSWTQFCKGYKANDKFVYSDFMSPFESLLSIGMDYQQSSKNNKFKISATLSPLALKFKYVGRPSLIKSFGLNEGHHAKWDYGSNVTINYNWKIINNITWVGRIYYFTDYSKTQIEWENTFNLAINRYLSARLFLYPRYDDSRNRKDEQSDFEFNELLSLGLNVNF